MGFLYWCWERLLVSEVNNKYFTDKYFKTVFWVAILHGNYLQLLLEHDNFLNIDISQGSIATYLLVEYLNMSLLQIYHSLPAKKLWKSVNVIFRGSYGQEFSVLFFDSRCRVHSYRTAIEWRSIQSSVTWQVVARGGVTSHRPQGPKTVKGAQSDPDYVSRLLLDCVPVFHKIITPADLLYRS